MCVVNLDYLWWRQVQVSVYCARRIPAHRRYTQCSILLHHIDICFLTCICLSPISQTQTYLCVVVGPGLVSKSPAFMWSIVSHSAGPHVQKNGNRAPITGGGRSRHNLHRVCKTAVTAPPRAGCVVFHCRSVNHHLQTLTRCLSVNHHLLILTSCLSVNHYLLILTRCLSVRASRNFSTFARTTFTPPSFLSALLEN